jgi:hypothetical protein
MSVIPATLEVEVRKMGLRPAWTKCYSDPSSTNKVGVVVLVHNHSCVESIDRRIKIPGLPAQKV